MKGFKKVVSVSMASLMVLSGTVSFAAQGDFYKADGTEYKGSNEVMGNKTEINKVLSSASEYAIEMGNGKVYTLGTIREAYAKYGNDYANKLDEYTPIKDLNQKLQVVSVSAINQTTIKVQFSQAVDSAAVSNFALSKGTVETVELVEGNTIAVLNVKGLTYGDETAVTVSNIVAGTAKLESYTKTVKVPAFGEMFEVRLELGESAILADGLSKTMVKAQIFDKSTNEPVKLKGLVNFTTTKGSFAQDKVSFDQNGVAALQLTSEVSTSTITAFITATVIDVPGATEYEGLVGSGQVRFAPSDQIEQELQLVSIVNVSASQADRINITLSGAVKREDIIAGYTSFTAAQADNFGFRIDGFGGTVNQAGIVKDIRQVNEKTLQLILDTDGKADGNYGSTTAGGTTRLEYDHLKKTAKAIESNTNTDITASAFNGAYLRDNMTHNVSTTNTNISKRILSNTDGINFVLTDTSTPWIAAVDVKDAIELEVIFSESMASDLIEVTETVITGTDSAKLYKNLRIDGKRLMQTANPDRGAATADEKRIAKQKNYILVNSLTLNEYDKASATKAGEDGRDTVNIKIDPSSMLANGEYSVQASNVGDWAGMTHAANILETQTFDFVVDSVAKEATAEIVQQSAEQWLIKFNTPVKLADNKELKDSIKIFSADKFEAKEEFVLGTDYQVTSIYNDGDLADGTLKAGTINGFADNAKSNTVNGVKYLLVEFKQDWTEKYQTASEKINYFHSTKNPYKVVLENWVTDPMGTEMKKATLDVRTPLDAQSPKIADAKDVYDLKDKSLRGANPTDTGQFVYIKMDEPVQLRNSADTIKSTPLTPSQQQSAGAGVPVPTFEFVKGDDTVPGSMVNGTIAQDDKTFVVEPDTELSPGTWTLIIRSISDDVGNTSATETREFTVKEKEAAVTGTNIAWIGFDDSEGAATDADPYDYVYVKFTQEMKSTGANGVSRTTNYTLNNNRLPEGAEVIQGIKGVTSEWDGVTIKMRPDVWNGTVDSSGTDFTTVFGVASNFESVGSEKLSGPHTVQLSKTTEQGRLGSDMKLEAIYRNENLDISNYQYLPVKGVVFTDSAAGDGKFDTIVLTLHEEFNKGKFSVSSKYKVNGVEYNAVETTPGKVVTLTNTTNNAISTKVAPRDIKITTLNGAIISNKGSVGQYPIMVNADRDFESTTVNQDIYITSSVTIKNLTMAANTTIYVDPGTNGEVIFDSVDASAAGVRVVVLSGAQN